MTVSNFRLNGYGHAYTERRKPWWKFLIRLRRQHCCNHDFRLRPFESGRGSSGYPLAGIAEVEVRRLCERLALRDDPARIVVRDVDYSLIMGSSRLRELLSRAGIDADAIEKCRSSSAWCSAGEDAG
ncbi:MAG: hypothetical protein WKF55_02315 [Gemmatimonadaceae bacterium]